MLEAYIVSWAVSAILISLWLAFYDSQLGGIGAALLGFIAGAVLPIAAVLAICAYIFDVVRERQ